MKYMLVVIEPTGQREERGEAGGREAYAQMQRFAQSLQAKGQLVAVESLVSQRSATRVSSRAGAVQVLDGPFAEVKEMIGGFFVVDCETRDEAVRLALECPAAAWATVEVRELGPCFL